MRPRKVFLLILLLLAGASIETTWRLRNHLDFVPLGWRVFGGRFYGPSYSFDESRSAVVAPGVSVSVANAFGGVHITKGEPGQVRVALRKVVFLSSEAAAQALAARVEIRTRAEGQELEVGTNRDDLESSGALANAGLETHLDLAVPPGTSVKIRNEHGRIDVSDVARAEVAGAFEPVKLERVDGDADVKAQHGNVMISSVSGDVHLSSRHGDVHLQDVAGATTGDMEHGKLRAERTGALEIDIKHGDLQAEAVGGGLQVRGEHSGVRASGVSGPADVETSFDDVRLDKLAGSARVKMEHGAVSASDVAGAVNIEATFGNVHLSQVGGNAEVVVEHGGLRGDGLRGGATVRVSGDGANLTGFRGAVRVEVTNGNARLAPGGPFGGPVSVSTRHGGITLRVPSEAGFDLIAGAEPGDVRVDLPGFTSSEASESRVKGRAGAGGSVVTLDAQHGDVLVENEGPAEADDPEE